jgi:hypothetical protein
LVLLCGGDDKELHFIKQQTQNEFKTEVFENYVWKCKSYPPQKWNNAIICTYSFDYFDNSKSINKIIFSSKIICINEFLESKWVLEGFNTECINFIENLEDILICVGTTKGELIIIEEKTGKILFKTEYSSCLNYIQFNREKKVLFCSHDDGTLKAFDITEILS